MISIAGFPIDVFVREKLAHKSEITDHPVEEGVDVTDNIHNLPDELEIEGVVSDNPTGELADDPTRQGDSRASVNAYQRLLAIHRAREPVTVVCFRGKFESMGLEELEIDTEAKSSKGLVFTGKFKKLVIVQNKRATVGVPNQHRGAGDSKLQAALGTFVNTVRNASPQLIASYTKIFGPPVKASLKNVAGDGPVPLLIAIPKGEYYFKTGKNGTPDSFIRNGVVNPFNFSGGFGTPGTPNYDYGQQAWYGGDRVPTTKSDGEVLGGGLNSIAGSLVK